MNLSAFDQQVKQMLEYRFWILRVLFGMILMGSQISKGFVDMYHVQNIWRWFCKNDFTIYIGSNSKENLRSTVRLEHPPHLWLHRNCCKHCPLITKKCECVYLYKGWSAVLEAGFVLRLSLEKERAIKASHFNINLKKLQKGQMFADLLPSSKHQVCETHSDLKHWWSLWLGPIGTLQFSKFYKTWDLSGKNS